LRIPRKKELIELQKKYRTDKKIGEVYGVPARLVTYWRQKKKIGPYSYPKYSEEKILEIWERYGDDNRAGADLGISPAGFRQWRRKYGIDKKPMQLRLEQLELDLIDINFRKNSRRETTVQKILARKCGLKKAEVGDQVSAEPDLAVSHEQTERTIELFRRAGNESIWNTGKLVIVMDQHLLNGSGERVHSRHVIRDFVKKYKIRNFYDIGEGICHQVVFENGHALPGNLICGTDCYTSSYGCLGAMSLDIGFEEMASVWGTGKINLKVPESVKITIKGRVGRGVYAGDIALKFMREIAGDITAGKAVEFAGPTIETMSISERFALTNTARELGALTAIVPYDDVTARFARRLSKIRLNPVRPDPDAVYSGEIEFDVSYLTPQVGCPDREKRVVPVEEAAGKRIDLVVVGSCSSGRIEDLESAARVLRGRRIHRDIRMIVVPGSRKVFGEALDRGLIKTFVDSGCIVANPGCDPCLFTNSGGLSAGERALTTTSRVFNGSSGNGEAEIYSSSPATASASALEGAITDPRKYER